MPDQSTRIFAIRHGETQWNVGGRIQGHLDIALNDTGRRQAQQLSAALAEEPIALVYSSDLSRAVETAVPLAEPRGQKVVLHAGLRERNFGEFQGHTFHEIEANNPDEAIRWRKRDPDFAPEGGESLRQFYQRCVDTVFQLAAAHAGQTIAIVAHGGVMDCLYRCAVRIDLQAPRSWLLGNASVNRLLYTSSGLSLIGWGDTSHLSGVSLDEIARERAAVGHEYSEVAAERTA